ncbi:hypothetical protein GWI33_022066 [Rhynchophorus ferrugineus]|uniref:Uncharacterized protein n=1 Tax=Rhynchophorus ferrugineus TaxID=354439 RepID=A0A834J0R7_RHYFE|nr:hypothetical protein GWI33_022066 [Rhynchophorus ferrugineus]
MKTVKIVMALLLFCFLTMLKASPTRFRRSEVQVPADNAAYRDIPSVILVKRSPQYRGHHYEDYENNNDYYNDDDWAGYDRKGFDVGLMDKNDDFPTVVW